MDIPRPSRLTGGLDGHILLKQTVERKPNQVAVDRRGHAADCRLRSLMIQRRHLINVGPSNLKPTECEFPVLNPS